jgi:hypothetical protein
MKTATRRPSGLETSRLLSQMAADGVPLTPGAILDAVEHPRWETTSGGSDWRTHVPRSVRSEWDALPLATRLCVFATAELVALDEDPGTSMVTGSAG